MMVATAVGSRPCDFWGYFYSRIHVKYFGNYRLVVCVAVAVAFSSGYLKWSRGSLVMLGILLVDFRICQPIYLL